MDQDLLCGRAGRSGPPYASGRTVRGVVWIQVARIGALAVLGMAMSGCALLSTTAERTQTQTQVASGVGANQVAALAAAGAAVAAEDRFVTDVVRTLKQSTGLARPQIITVGQHLCTAISGSQSHAALIDQLREAKFDPQAMEVFLSSAEKDLCPQAGYGRPNAAPLTFPPTTGALTTITDGTYEVGTGPGQVLPGTYHSTGPTVLMGTCHYSRLRINDGSLIDVIRQHDTYVATSFTLDPADGYVQVSGCTFTLT